MEVSGVPTERKRVAVCFAVGVVVGVAVGLLTSWELGTLSGWVAAAVGFVVSVWHDLAGLDADATSALATREDDSRAASRLLVVGASLASLIAVVAGLRRASRLGGGWELALTIGSLIAVVTAWAVVHTVHVLRYAHLYYDGTAGGVDFPGDEPPAYRDFAYLAFTVGMTFQVSDTDITTRDMRSALLRHALLSFVFGTAIIASTINVLASLVSA